MPRVEFEPTISAGERPKTYALERAATGTGPVITLATDFAYSPTQCHKGILNSSTRFQFHKEVFFLEGGY